MGDNLFVNFRKIVKNGLWVKITSFTLLFGALLAVIALSKGVFGTFIQAAIPMIIINELIIFYGISQGAKKSIIIPLCILNYISALSQTLLGFAGINVVVLLSIALIAVVVFSLITLKINRIIVIYSAFILMIAAFLVCPFVKTINGVKGWLIIGGLSIQLTEVAKIFYFLSIGSLLSLPIPEKKRFLISFCVTCLFAGILFFISELGTALVVLSAFAVTILTTFKKKAWKLFIILCIIIVIIAGAIGYNLVAKDMYKWECPYCETLNKDTQQCTHCKKTTDQAMIFKYLTAEYADTWKCPDCLSVNEYTETVCKKCRNDVMADGYSFNCRDCKFTQWKGDFGEGKEKTDPESCKNCNAKYQKLLNGTIKKVYDRFVVVFGYDKVQGEREAYHMEMNKKAIKVGSFIGNDETIIDVPNFDTDSVFAALVNRLGIIFGFFIMLIFLILFLNTYDINSPFRMLAVCIFLFQAMYTFLGTLNIFPLTGIGIPLLSRGGTNLVISYILIYFMLTARHTREVAIDS